MVRINGNSVDEIGVLVQFPIFKPQFLKKLAAILLIALLAFNWLGYRLFIDFIEERETAALQAELDKRNYEESGLREFRFVLNMPYTSNSSDFEDYAGETEIDGVHYNFVKRKLVNDTLILLCIPNEKKNELQTAKAEYFKQINDLQQGSKKSNSSKDYSGKTVVSDYLLKENAVNLRQDEDLLAHHSNYSDIISSRVSDTKDRPPQA